MPVFKEALNHAINSTGKNASSLAPVVGVSRTRLSEFINGTAVPKDDNIVKLCAAFPPDHAAKLAQAWVRERLGDGIADSILATDNVSKSPLATVYSSLPTETQNSFLVLMQVCRTNTDLRNSLQSLASFMIPEPEPVPVPKAEKAPARKRVVKVSVSTGLAELAVEADSQPRTRRKP